MNCRRGGCFPACQGDPTRAVPVLKTIAPDAALRVVIPSADGFHQRDNVETLLFSQIHLQPARGLAFIQVPARSEVTVVRLIRSHGIRVGASTNGLALRQVPCRDYNVLAESCHGAGMLPRFADLFQSAHNVRSQASFTGWGSIQNQVTVSAIQRLKPLV